MQRAGRGGAPWSQEVTCPLPILHPPPHLDDGVTCLLPILHPPPHLDDGVTCPLPILHPPLHLDDAVVEEGPLGYLPGRQACAALVRRRQRHAQRTQPVYAAPRRECGTRAVEERRGSQAA